MSDSLSTAKGTGFSYRTFEPAEGGLHQDLGRERRIRAGLRYADGGKKKYWVPLPGEEGDAHGRKGRGGLAARPLHAAKKFLEDRLDLNEGYAPLTAEEAHEAVHRAPDEEEGVEGLGDDYDREDWKRWKEQIGVDYRGRHDDDEESEAESLGFEGLEEDEDAEKLYDDAKALEFGDWSYPVVDASKEEARRRMREEEEGRVFPNRLKNKNGKGKETESKKFSYGELAEGDDRPPHQTSSPSDPTTSSDHPLPDGTKIIHGAKKFVHQVTAGQSKEDEEALARKRREEERNRLPSDAIDLVVEE